MEFRTNKDGVNRKFIILLRVIIIIMYRFYFFLFVGERLMLSVYTIKTSQKQSINGISMLIKYKFTIFRRCRAYTRRALY